MILRPELTGSRHYIMPAIGQAANWVVLGFLAALGATLLAGMLNGQIETRHLFWARGGDGRMRFSPERVQLLLFTVWAAGGYLAQLPQAIPAHKLPDVSSQTLALLGASHGVFLGGKAWSMLSRQ